MRNFSLRIKMQLLTSLMLAGLDFALRVRRAGVIVTVIDVTVIDVTVFDATMLFEIGAASVKKGVSNLDLERSLHVAATA